MPQYTFIIFGPSGSGKGTQAELLIEYLKKTDPNRQTFYIETGQRFREFAKDNSYTAKLVKEIIDHGSLAPEFLPIWMWTDFLVKNISGNEHLILDGLSRVVHEAPVLDSAMRFYKRENPFVISIEVSERWSTERLLSRARTDDTLEDIKNRLSWYKKSVTPAIDYFKNDPYYKFVEVNGEQTIPEVHKEIMGKLNIRSNE